VEPALPLIDMEPLSAEPRGPMASSLVMAARGGEVRARLVDN